MLNGQVKGTFEKGDIVISKAGHDIGRMYIVINALNEFVFVADGDYRLHNNLKKKRAKHLRYVETTELKSNITDTELKRIIKLTKSKQSDQCKKIKK